MYLKLQSDVFSSLSKKRLYRLPQLKSTFSSILILQSNYIQVLRLESKMINVEIKNMEHFNMINELHGLFILD